ncbi:MAG TPA: hypothetical protein VG146_09650 [Verrucomicrobiae bacterium]|nr:hypothetical protein [Verrucomicrobiae bacterium]
MLNQSKGATLLAAILAGIFCGLVSGFCGAPGTVYLVVGSDTAIWNAVTTVDVYTRHPYYSQNSFTQTNAPIFQVMDSAWRSQFKDSFGQTIKFTWWMMGGNIYRDAINLNVPIADTMTLHLMKQYHGQAIRQFGDELSLHYHTFMWSDYNGTGTYYWNQTRTFNERRADFDFTLAQYLLEEGIFPVSFRSGWHFMDQAWQQHLNELIPFCFHDNYGVKVSWYTNAGPIAGVEDWSRAPSAFVPFHASTNDYQIPGDTPGWNVRSVKIQNLTQSTVDEIFAQGSNGVDQVACFWDHLPENFAANIVKLGGLLSQAAALYPKVPFRYCTAVEAMQRWLGATNLPAPVLDVVPTVQDQTLTLAITSSAPIFQEKPFVCLRDVFQQYTNLTSMCVRTGSNSWNVALPAPSNLVAKVAVAVTDAAGNLATNILRFLPDDLYLDNLDPEYSESQGTWTSTTNAAWGIDARLMLLDSNNTAQADWSLPIAWSGRYRLAVQAPAIRFAATNVAFNVLSGTTNLFSALFPLGVPTNQWVFIGSVVLDAALSNHVSMVVSGANQPGAYAVADVLRVVPAPDWAYAAPGVQSAVAVVLANSFLIRFAGQAGVAYTVQHSSDLTGSWSTQVILKPNTTGTLEFEDERPLPGQAFFRILGR